MSVPSILIHNASVLTMDDDCPRASAVALAGNSVLAVGGEDLLSLASTGTRIIDAQGRTVLPGFNDSHLHLFIGAVGLAHLDLTHIKGVDALRDAVRSYAAEHPDEFLLCAEFTDYSILGEGVAITRHVLDEILPDRPFVMTAFDNHTSWCNTAALKAGGILQGRALPVGNEIVMGEDGQATGELREADAMAPVRSLSATGWREGLGMATGGDPESVTEAERASDREILRRGLAYCAQNGVTSIQNMDGTLYTLELLEEIDREIGLPVRVRVPFHCKNFTELSEFTSRAARWRERFTGSKLRSDFVKMFIDGVTESGTAVFLGGYGDAPEENGDPLFSQDALNAAVAEADRLGFQVAIHAIGDGGIRMVLDAYENAACVNGRRDSRHRIEHIEVLHPADLPRFAALGVVASMQPVHVPGAGLFGSELYLSRIGRERWPGGFPVRSLKESGARVVYSTDWPVVPLAPMLTVKCAVCRKPWAEGLKDEALDLHETLEAYTRAGAWVEFCEDEKGMLRPGMLADLVMLDGDIEAVAPDAIESIAPGLTICDGVVTFSRAP
ncbi:amidohydrolase [Salipiger sp. 1_MG-2023]|uniref:amidohydrolase n=1 Tax=Salipiger sp. 1_MG-2023 TaxID=3062665 RepID=UPI0026E15A38|nr:amidohydrolase [Salipiger sp. 1_MG-2023]MDO6585315.1 amidohydrolase [Salipiger sp. 1_MG-2023]